MATNILVFSPEKEVYTEDIDKSERQIFYESLEKEFPEKDQHFREFFYMGERILSEKISRSNIPEILIRQALKYCVPIVLENPMVQREKKVVERKVVKKDLLKKVFDPTKVKKEEKIREAKQKKYVIITNLDYPIHATVLQSKEDIMIPSNINFKIVGVRLVFPFVHYWDESIPLTFQNIGVAEMISIGGYGLRNHVSNVYTQQLDYFSHIGTLFLYKGIDITSNDTIFISDADAINKINIILTYLESVNFFYKSFYYTIFEDIFEKTPFKENMDKTIANYENFSELIIKHVPIRIFKEDDILKKMKVIYRGEWTYNSRLSLLSSLSNANILNLYYKFTILGEYDKEANRIFNKIKDNIEKDKIKKMNEKRRSKIRRELSERKKIALEKFNTANLSDLSEKQLNILDLEYKRREKMRKKPMNYILLDLINNLHILISMKNVKKIKSTIQNLKEYMKIPKLDDLVKMNSFLRDEENNDVICPHIIAKALKIVELDKAKAYSDQRIEEFLIDEFAMKEKEEINGYYCRIDGEKLAVREEQGMIIFDEEGRRISHFYGADDLTRMMWKEVASIILSFIYFKKTTNLKIIVNAIVDLILEKIRTFETRSLQIKTNTPDNIRILLLLMIDIYSFAVLIYMIIKNKDNMGFYDKFVSPEKLTRVKRNHVKVESKILQSLLQTSLNIILSTKKTYIDRSENITPNSIKPLLVKAYRWVLSVKEDIEVEIIDKDTEQEITRLIKIDPVYNYIYTSHLYYYNFNCLQTNRKNFYNDEDQKADIKKLEEYLDVKTVGDKDICIKKPDFDDVRRYLGRTVKEIKDQLETVSVYDTMIIPFIWDKSRSEEAIYKYYSFIYIVDFIKKKMFLKSIVPLDDTLLDFFKQYDGIMVLEEKLMEDIKRKIARPLSIFKSADNIYRRAEKTEIAKIGQIYCIKGGYHDLDIYIYQKADKYGKLSGKKYELTTEEIIDWLESGNKKKLDEFNEMYFIDTKCTKCNQVYSKIKDDKRTISMINKNNKMKRFYEYFEVRCPKGEFHDFAKDKKTGKLMCKKCGLVPSFKQDLNISYYNKFVKVLEKIQKEKDKRIRESLELRRKVYRRKFLKFPEWETDNSPMLEWARLSNQNYNTIINIGLSEGVEYEDILTEKINPQLSTTEDMDNKRSMNIYNYIMMLFRYYYLLKNWTETVDIPPELRAAFEKQRKIDISDLNKYLPDIVDEFYEKYDYYVRTLNPKLLSNFLLNFLSSSIIIIHKTLEKSKKFKELGDKLLQVLTNKIIEIERITAKIDPRKIIVPEYDPEKIEEKVRYISGDDYEGRITEPEVEPETVEDIVEKVEMDDPFTLEDMDVEQDSDEFGEEENLVNNAIDF
jgi:hypothetical protein